MNLNEFIIGCFNFVQLWFYWMLIVITLQQVPVYLDLWIVDQGSLKV